jgi:hypothetical protein
MYGLLRLDEPAVSCSPELLSLSESDELSSGVKGPRDLVLRGGGKSLYFSDGAFLFFGAIVSYLQDPTALLTLSLQDFQIQMFLNFK